MSDAPVSAHIAVMSAYQSISKQSKACQNTPARVHIVVVPAPLTPSPLLLVGVAVTLVVLLALAVLTAAAIFAVTVVVVLVVVLVAVVAMLVVGDASTLPVSVGLVLFSSSFFFVFVVRTHGLPHARPFQDGVSDGV